jgi:hypothetical protein
MTSICDGTPGRLVAGEVIEVGTAGILNVFHFNLQSEREQGIEWEEMKATRA